MGLRRLRLFPADPRRAVTPLPGPRTTFVSQGDSCPNAANFPSLQKTLTLKSGERTSITFTPEKGTTAFSRGVGICSGRIIAR